MTLSDTVLRNIFISFLGRVYTALLTFVVVAVLLPRILSEEGFGIFSFYLTVFTILGVIIDFGSNAIAVRDGSKEPGRMGSLLHSLTWLRGGMSLFCFAAACGVGFLFEEGREARILVVLAAIHLFFHTLGGFGVIFQVQMKFGWMVLAQTIGHTCFFAVALAFFLSGRDDPFLYLFAVGAGLAISNTIFFFLGRRHLPGPIRGGSSEFLRLFREALPLGISAVTAIAFFQIDTILIRPLEGEEAVGLYSAAFRMLTFTIMVPVLFNQVLLPVYSRYISSDPRRFLRIFRRAVLYMGVVGAPVSVALAVLAGPVLLLIFPETYIRSEACLKILGLAVAIIFVTYPHVSVLIATGRQATFTWISVVGLLLNVALNLVLIPLFSIEGAAWATVATEAYVLLAASISIRRHEGYWAFSAGTVKIVPAAAAIGAAAWLLRGEPILLVMAVLAVLLGGILFFFKMIPFDLEEDENRY